MVITTLLGYLVLIAFFLMEGRLRIGVEAKSFDAGHFDQHTPRLLGQAYCVSALALLAAWPLNLAGVGKLPDWIGWFGILLALVGLFTRAWAARVLGAFYTRTLKVSAEQTIIGEGPYRLIRHPGYLGMILLWTGVATATTNWIVILIVLVVECAAYHYRMENEEKMLLATNADYAAYRLHTWRLIPLIY